MTSSIAIKLPKKKLTPRETEVLELLANGKSRKEIAQILPIKAVTVRAYLESAREKLKARNVLHATAIALALGMIEMSASDYLINESSRSENTKEQANLVCRHRQRKNY